MQLIAPPPPTRSSGRWIVSPSAGTRIGESRRRALERRRRIFEAMTGVVVGTFFFSLFSGAWQLHFFADAVLFSYAVVLVGQKRSRIETTRKIRPLPRERRESEEPFIFNEPARAGGHR